jgi:hypothetical protein
MEIILLLIRLGFTETEEGKSLNKGILNIIFQRDSDHNDLLL